MKTENLAILMTDIAGYTEATAHLSRKENEQLLENHNRILLPIIRRFKGTLVKTIGDALLMVFRSPTDAMLCAMAMQDALFEYNRDLPEEHQIHIRVAASLGEVRVTRSDIFGEPVNTTSRIEGITPSDEIYLSDAVYMAMNKAEVPCREVGLRQLKGISEQVRIWEIPRFSRPRLVPEDVMSAEDMSGIVFPYGGAHLVGRRDDANAPGEGEGIRKVLISFAAVLLMMGTATAFYYFGTMKSSGLRPGDEALLMDTAPWPPDGNRKSDEAPEKDKPGDVASENEMRTQAVPTPKESVAPPVPARVEPEPEKPAVVKATPEPAPASLAPKQASYKVLVKEPLADVEIIPTVPVESAQGPVMSSLNEIKTAYRDGTITREEYNEQVKDARIRMRDELQEARQEYSEGRLDRRTYKEKVAEIKQKYR